MNTNKITFIGSVIFIVILVSLPTIYKVVKNHQENLLKVVEDKIINSAKACYYDEVCQNEHITLKELYENNYIEELSNPITKEYYNEECYVTVSDFKFVEVE